MPTRTQPMNGRQYQQLVANRRRAVLVPLFDAGTADGLLRRAARSLKRRERAQRALDAVVPRDVSAATRVAGLENGTLWLVAPDPVVRERLRRQTPRLVRDLARRVPDLARIRITRTEQGSEHESGSFPAEGE